MTLSKKKANLIVKTKASTIAFQYLVKDCQAIKEYD